MVDTEVLLSYRFADRINSYLPGFIVLPVDARIDCYLQCTIPAQARERVVTVQASRRAPLAMLFNTN